VGNWDDCDLGCPYEVRRLRQWQVSERKGGGSRHTELSGRRANVRWQGIDFVLVSSVVAEPEPDRAGRPLAVADIQKRFDLTDNL
jgi:hypothetical protein